MNDGDVRSAVELINKRLGWIEENLGRVQGLQYVAMGRADHRPDESPIPADVLELVRAGKTMDAIKRYRELTGVDFAHAREALEGIS